MIYTSRHLLAMAAAFLAALSLGPAASWASRDETALFISAEMCGQCHVETYESWSRTFHALAAIDPVFVEAMKRVRAQEGEEAGGLCLTCHSPAAVRDGSPDPSSALLGEGVTCSFCHSVTAVDFEAPRGRFTNDQARLAVGPAGHARGDHHFENHDLMMRSEFCAGCHEWVNAQGLRILSTYTEWKDSFYSGEQVSCQQCHMPASMGSSVMAAGETKSPRVGNLHFQMGGHSQEQLVAAAQVEVTHEVRDGKIHLNVAITNTKAGHRLPTGLPTRKMNLVVELYDREGMLIESRNRVYGRVIADGEGRVLEDVVDQFLHGAREISDSRIEPKETRRERFVFPRPAGGDFVLLEVSLVYEILTPYLAPPVLRFDVSRRRIPVSFDGHAPDGVPPSLSSLIIIAALFIVTTLVSAAILFGRYGRGNSHRERKE